MTVEWVACEARTGAVITYLPELTLGGALKRTLGRSEALTVSMHFESAPENWRRATQPGAAFLVCLEDDDPIWGALILKRTTTGSNSDDTDSLLLDLVTLEAYLDRRYVGDQTVTGRGQHLLVADLVNAYIADGNVPGVPIRVDTSAGAGVPRDRTYLDSDDKTVLAVLTELMGVIGGPEFTIEWEWAPGTTAALRPVLVTATPIGDQADYGLPPAATFDLPGAVIAAKLVESYDSGQGANDVLAKSTSTDDVRPQARATVTNYDSRPTFQYRWSPSSSIITVETLEQHAEQALAILAPGAAALTLTAHAEAAPKLGADWRLGDMVAWSLHTTRKVDGRVVGRPPWDQPLAGQARAIGWERDLAAETVSPILLTPDLGAA